MSFNVVQYSHRTASDVPVSPRSGPPIIDSGKIRNQPNSQILTQLYSYILVQYTNPGILISSYSTVLKYIKAQAEASTVL